MVYLALSQGGDVLRRASRREGGSRSKAYPDDVREEMPRDVAGPYSLSLGKAWQGLACLRYHILPPDGRGRQAMIFLAQVWLWAPMSVA